MNTFAPVFAGTCPLTDARHVTTGFFQTSSLLVDGRYQATGLRPARDVLCCSKRSTGEAQLSHSLETI